MRVLLQRVSGASVRVAGEVVGRVGKGVLLLVGVTHSDGDAEVNWMVEKIIGLRVFADSEGRMNLALGDVGGGVLAVSQFTLYGDARKGRRPSYTDAAGPEHAEAIYELFLNRLRERGVRVEAGVFGAMMQVELVNDGPVTLWLEQ